MKLKTQNWDETQKLKLWWYSETQVVMELKNSNCDETQKPNCNDLKTQIVMKFKNSNCDKTQKPKLWQNSKNI